MRAQDFICEGISGTFVHETTPEAATEIAKHGFKMSPTGIFFNQDNTGYSGGTYGGAKILAKINASKVLDLTDDLPDDLDEFADGVEIAEYTKKHGYQAWMDELQIAVFDLRAIQIVGIEK